MPEQKPSQIENDVIVNLAFTLTVDGEVIDEATAEDPFFYLHGHENVITGIENAVNGMKIGDSKSFDVKPEDGYGEPDPDGIMHLPRTEFPEDLPLEVGMELEMRDEDGRIVYATVGSMTKSMVKLDFNHPLAGKDLHFDVTVLDLQTPSPEELAHGHVHHD